MVNPELDYVKVEVDGEKWILAKGLAGAVIQAVFNKKFKVIEEFKGNKLEGIEYVHPWEDEIKEFKELKKKYPRVHTIVLSSEYVSLEAGSGLVHCAPGCGPEDYEVGYIYNIPPFNNIDQYGVFPQGMGRFSGLKAKTDDARFIEALKEKGVLLAEVPVEHDYAHCERCHKPVVFRTTKQWFFKVEDLKDKMLKANQKIYWVPIAGKNAFDSWLLHLRDNSITKQRFWGTPVPIWKCEKCGKYVVVENADELKKLGAEKIPDNLHKPWIDEVELPCECGGSKKRLPDILDVWIDAGSASWNCLEYPKRKDFFETFFPADFILEAKEQVRGWFNLLMVASMLALGKPCFKAVYMHGMLTDIEGKKMSKSLGNVISPYELIDKYGADTLRYYMCSTPAGEDINFAWEEAAQRYRNLVVLWNIHNYLIESARLFSINPSKTKPKNLDVEEYYILSKLNRTIKEVTELYEAYRLDEVPKLLEELFMELSRTYIQITREKLASEPEKVIYTIYTVLLQTMKMLATLTPFITERMYIDMKEAFGLDIESIHLCRWPKYDKKRIDEKLEKRVELVNKIVQAILAARKKAELGIRWPLKSAIIVTTSNEVKEAVEVLADLVKVQTNIKNVKVAEQIEGAKIEISENKEEISKEFGENSARILSALDKRLLEKIRKDGEAIVEGFRLTREHINIKEILPQNLVSEGFKEGNVYIDIELTPELEAEGFAREVTRRVQNFRKDLASWGKEIKTKVGARALYFEDKGFEHSYQEKIKGHNFKIGLRVLK